VFANIHVSMLLDVCPPPGTQLPAAAWPLGACALLLCGSIAIEGVRRHARRLSETERTAFVPWFCAIVVVAMLAAGAAYALDLAGQMRAGLTPSEQAWSATVAAMLGYQ